MKPFDVARWDAKRAGGTSNGAIGGTRYTEQTEMTWFRRFRRCRYGWWCNAFPGRLIVDGGVDDEHGVDVVALDAGRPRDEVEGAASSSSSRNDVMSEWCLRGWFKERNPATGLFFRPV